MKMRIDKGGTLFLDRGFGEKPAGCPVSGGQLECGDWCALFGGYWPDSEKRPTLWLCNENMHEGTMVDERGAVTT